MKTKNLSFQLRDLHQNKTFRASRGLFGGK